MSYIPDDIMQSAHEATREWNGTGALVERIARAILAERQRCAAFAETYELADNPRLSPGSEMNAWWSGQERAYEAVRRGILHLPSLPTPNTTSNQRSE